MHVYVTRSSLGYYSTQIQMRKLNAVRAEKAFCGLNLVQLRPRNPAVRLNCRGYQDSICSQQTALFSCIATMLNAQMKGALVHNRSQISSVPAPRISRFTMHAGARRWLAAQSIHSSRAHSSKVSVPNAGQECWSQGMVGHCIRPDDQDNCFSLFSLAGKYESKRARTTSRGRGDINQLANGGQASRIECNAVNGQATHSCNHHSCGKWHHHQDV